MAHRFLAIVAAFLVVLTVPAFTQTSDSARLNSPKPPAWDVIYVKPNHSQDSSGIVSKPAAELELRNMALGSVILSAFDIKSNNQLKLRSL